MKRSSAFAWPGMLKTIVVMPTSTIARPAHVSLSRELPRRNAAASPTGKRLTIDGIKAPSTNEIAVAKNQ